MDRKIYERTTEKEFIGRRVISLVKLRNGQCQLPTGTTFTIEGKQGGFELLSDQCPHCGIKIWITKVPPRDVDFTDQQNLWPKS